MRFFSPAPAQWLVVGLGNPGAQYAATRHNVGYMVVDELLDGATWAPVRGIPALTARLPGDVLLARSKTYMNNSGEAVGPLAKRFHVEPGRIIVIHDELDLPVEKLKIKLGGNENGHNGLKSVSAHLGTPDYVRVRIGIGRPAPGVSVIDHVLGAAGPKTPVERAAEAVRTICRDGVVKAQNTVNG